MRYNDASQCWYAHGEGGVGEGVVEGLRSGVKQGKRGDAQVDGSAGTLENLQALAGAMVLQFVHT